jgi:hypothetical protein
MCTTALADTSSMNADRPGMGILENEWVKAGVNGTTGTFGSGGNTSPGLLFDPEGTGTFNTSYDYLTPGSPFDGFSVKVDGTNYTNNNGDGGSVAIANDGNGLTDGENSLSWTGGVSGVFNITNTYSLAPNTPYIDGSASITMLTDATTLSFGKFIDPDSQGMPGDSSATDNVLGYGVIPSTNVAFSEATVSRYALGLYTTDTNVTAGINSWSTEADGYNGTNYYKPLLDADGNIQWQNPSCTFIAYCGFEKELDADGNPIKLNYGTSDDTIGISWVWSNVSTGDILTASYAYIFGPSAFDAASDAIEGGAGGGDTTTTDSWGTLEDVGSATDAASGGGSTPEPVITTETVVDTSRPVLTASITHHESSVAAGVQTIDRETTTTTTTPMVTNTYTDGTLTSSAVATSTVSTAVTDPGSFVGRMDQGSQLANLDVASNLGFANGVGGGRISHTMGNGYSAESTVWGLGHTVVAENGMRITGGLNFADTTMSGEGSTGAMSTTHFGVEVGKALDNRDLTVIVGGNVANSDISWDRTIGDFAAHGETSVSDTWGTLKVEKSTGAVRPWAGYTIGSKTVDGYTETGDIQSVLEGVAVDSSYNYATVGLNVEAGILDLGISKAFDANDTVNLSVGIDKHINDRIAIGTSANRTMSGDNESTFLTAGLRIKF